MSNKTVGIVLIVVGVIVIILDIVLGLTGFSSMGIGFGFGWKKILLGVAGVVVALIGVFLQMRATTPPSK